MLKHPAAQADASFHANWAKTAGQTVGGLLCIESGPGAVARSYAGREAATNGVKATRIGAEFLASEADRA